MLETISGLNMKKLYLDIDGVLLTNRNPRAADEAIELIDFILSRFDCYWLTTHCRENSSTNALRRLTLYFHESTIEKLKQIKPTQWNTLKTEAIDFESVFYWLDDYVLEAEKKELERHKCLQNLLLVDLMNDNELTKIIQKLI